MLHLDNLKKQAKQIVRWHREGYYPVAQRIRAGLPRFRDVDDATILSTRFALSDAQELIARELGFQSWQVPGAGAVSGRSYSWARCGSAWSADTRRGTCVSRRASCTPRVAGRFP